VSNKKFEDLRGKPVADLKTALEETRAELFKMKFLATTEPVDHPHKVDDARKRIARINTVLRQRELEATKKAAAATSATAGEKK
jgi:large subunit ribosomal protein L29